MGNVLGEGERGREEGRGRGGRGGGVTELEDLFCRGQHIFRCG